MALQYRSELKISTFLGLNTETKDLRELKLRALADGTYAMYTPDQRNWITLTNNKGIELRRGTALLGGTRQTGAGKITGLGVGVRADGTEVPFFTHGRKIKYYDIDQDDTVEAGSDVLPAAASGEEVSIFPYQNIAGAFVYLSSPTSSIYKIPVANPGSVVDQSSTTYRGFFKFGQSRGFLFNRHGATSGNIDETSLYVSAVDKVALSSYPSQVTAEAIGSSGSTSYTGTLAQRTGARTVMFVVIKEASGETLTDDRNGNLVGDQGSTGTINYATGAYDVTFNHTTTGAVTADYYYEDATSGGVCDFGIDDVSDREPGEGNVFPQFDGGGALRSVYPLATTFFCFHRKKTWQVSIPVDDESGTDSISINLPYREKLGVESHDGAFGGADGIYAINTAQENKPEFIRLEFYKSEGVDVSQAQPKLLSQLIDFSPYIFEKAVVREWGDYILVCCQQKTNGVADDFNSLMFMINKKNGAWDVMEMPVSKLEEYNGTLISGDPLTNNIFTLFSGFDEDGDIVNNYYTSGDLDLEMDGIKRFSRLKLEGLIQTSQRYEIDLAYDGGSFVHVATIEGTGAYVDSSKSIAVGSYVLGSKELGGGAIVYANPYKVTFRIQSPRFENVRFRIRASTLDDDNNAGGGYVSLHALSFIDIRQKSLRPLPEHSG